MAKASKKSPEEKLRVGPPAGLARCRCVRASSHQDHRPRSSKLIARTQTTPAPQPGPGDSNHLAAPRPNRALF